MYDKSITSLPAFPADVNYLLEQRLHNLQKRDSSKVPVLKGTPRVVTAHSIPLAPGTPTSRAHETSLVGESTWAATIT